MRRTNAAAGVKSAIARASPVPARHGAGGEVAASAVAPKAGGAAANTVLGTDGPAQP